jgi:hypothetical protein
MAVAAKLKLGSEMTESSRVGTAHYSCGGC